MPTTHCTIKERWTPRLNNGQLRLYEALENGSATVLYDKWAQQSYFVRASNAHCSSCPNFLPIGTAQDYDFRLRHLKMRGVRGLLNLALEDDYTEYPPEHHYSAPIPVKLRFDLSELFVVDTTDAAKGWSSLKNSKTSF